MRVRVKPEAPQFQVSLDYRVRPYFKKEKKLKINASLQQQSGLLKDMDQEDLVCFHVCNLEDALAIVSIIVSITKHL